MPDPHKLASKNPYCLWGWGPDPGYMCFRLFGHKGRCWDGGDPPLDAAQSSKRPGSWDHERGALVADHA